MGRGGVRQLERGPAGLDTASGECRLNLVEASRVHCVQPCLDMRHLVSGAEDGKLRIWDRQDGRTINVMNGHLGAINSVAVSRDGRFGLTAGDDRTIRVWDLASAQCLRTVESHEGPVTSVAFKGSLRKVVSASSDMTVRLHTLKIAYQAFE